VHSITRNTMTSETARTQPPAHLKRRFLFTYTLLHLPQNDKVRFFYALKGRDGKSGIIKTAKIDQLGKTVLLVDASRATELRDFLRYWRCTPSEQEVWMHG
jgi:hypothetical protein